MIVTIELLVLHTDSSRNTAHANCRMSTQGPHLHTSAISATSQQQPHPAMWPGPVRGPIPASISRRRSAAGQWSASPFT